MHTKQTIILSSPILFLTLQDLVTNQTHIKTCVHNRKKIAQKPSSMEEIVSLIFQGCKMVKDLEATLPNVANQPHFLFSSCDEISRVFGDAREQLSLAVQEYGHHKYPMAMEVGGGLVPQWLRSSLGTDMVLHELAHHQHHGLEAISGQEMDGGNVKVVATDVAPSSQRTRRRKHEADTRTFRIPAPRMGNTEVPVDDGYTWRKYGQKEILGSKFPRGYFRCTHQKLYNCPAKKQVQRLDNDPYTFEVTYRGDHTCTMSSTAPSMPPPPPPPEAMTAHSQQSHIPPSTSHSLTQIKRSVGDLYSITHPCIQTFTNQPDLGNEAGSSSPTRYVDYPAMTDFVDTMFNSGSSSNNSMKLIFSPSEEKKNGGEKSN